MNRGNLHFTRDNQEGVCWLPCPSVVTIVTGANPLLWLHFAPFFAVAVTSGNLSIASFIAGFSM